MEITNTKSYVAANALCEPVSDATLIWLHLHEVSAGRFRIVGHSYQDRAMYWDGSGVEPLVIDGPPHGERWTRRDIIDCIETASEERALAQST